MKPKHIAWLATLPLLAVPALSLAADGYTTGNVDLFAGPDPSYPLIDTLPAGAPLEIQGCTSGWEWCDVIFQGERGWIAGNYIEYDYDNQYVLVPQYGVQIGIPIVTFVISSYWDSHYRDRPFYRERDRWYARPMPHRPPPPPRYRPMPPPHGYPPQRPAHELPNRQPRPMPQRQEMAPPPVSRPAMPPRAPAAHPGNNGKPAPEHGKPAPRNKDKDDHQDH